MRFRDLLSKKRQFLRRHPRPEQPGPEQITTRDGFEPERLIREFCARRMQQYDWLSRSERDRFKYR